jgi:hypothetical protein
MITTAQKHEKGLRNISSHAVSPKQTIKPGKAHVQVAYLVQSLANNMQRKPSCTALTNRNYSQKPSFSKRQIPEPPSCSAQIEDIQE